MSLTRLDQAMAAHAVAVLGDDAVSKDLRTRMRQLPSRLRGSGLAATYVFLMARGRTDDPLGHAYARLTRQIARHVAEQHLLTGAPDALTPEEFLKRLSGASPGDYALVSAEVDALAGWLSRLADALYTPPPAGGVDGNG